MIKDKKILLIIVIFVLGIILVGFGIYKYISNNNLVKDNTNDTEILDEDYDEVYDDEILEED